MFHQKARPAPYTQVVELRDEEVEVTGVRRDTYNTLVAVRDGDFGAPSQRVEQDFPAECAQHVGGNGPVRPAFAGRPLWR